MHFQPPNVLSFVPTYALTVEELKEMSKWISSLEVIHASKPSCFVRHASILAPGVENISTIFSLFFEGKENSK
jgi:hypothetical protein